MATRPLPAPQVSVTPERWPSAATLRLQLDEVNYELSLMLQSLETDPTVTEEDKALYAERYAALRHAHSWLPGALDRAVKREASKLKRSGFGGITIKPETFL